MSMMPTAEDLKRLGEAVHHRRMELGKTSLRQFARDNGISHQRLSALERAYASPKQGISVPTDEVLEKLAAGLDWPLSRLHALLGRLPDHPFPAYDNPDAVRLAERYAELPPHAQEAILAMVTVIERVVLAGGQGSL